MYGLKATLDYFLFSKVKEADEKTLHDKAIQAMMYYRAISSSLRVSPLKIEVSDKTAYIVLPGGIHIPFMKLKRPRKGDHYEVWIATDTSLRYIMELLSQQ